MIHFNEFSWMKNYSIEDLYERRELKNVDLTAEMSKFN